MADPSKEALIDGVERALRDRGLSALKEDRSRFDGSDPVGELAGLAARLSRLPKADPPAAFTDEVMNRVKAVKRSPWASLWNRLTRPHLIRLNLLQALSGVAAVVFLALAAGLVARTDRGGQTAQTLGERRYVVQFTHVNPDASQVYVAGSFNNWQKDQVSLSRVSEQGVWVGTLILPPGVYEYMFVVDGEWVADQLARRTMEDGFGRKNALLYVADDDELKT